MVFFCCKHLFVYCSFFSAPLIASFYDRQELVNLSRGNICEFLFSGMAIVPHVILFKQLQVKIQAKIDVFALFLSGICGVLWHSMVLLGIGNSKYGVCGKCIFVEMDGCILAP